MFIRNVTIFLLRAVLVLHCVAISAQVLEGSPSFYVFVEEGRQGVKNDNNEVVIPAVYEQVGWSDSGFEVHGGVVGYKEDGKWGLLSITNRKITLPLYDILSINNSGTYILAFKNERLAGRSLAGLIDVEGNNVISHSYTRLEVYQESVLAYYPSGNNLNLAGLIDMKERVIIPFEYRTIRRVAPLRYFAEGDSGRAFLFDESGQSVATFTLDSLADYEREYARIWKGQFVGLIDRSGNIVIEPEYREVRITAKGIEAREFDKWQEISASNELLAEFRFDAVERLSDSLLKVTANQKNWLVNDRSERVSKVFEEIGDFHQGFAVTKLNGRVGVIRTDGDWLIKPSYDIIERSNGFFYTRDIQGRWRIVDQYGIEKTKGYFDEIGDYDKVYFHVRKGDFWGLITRDGEAALNCVFDSVSTIRHNMVSVKFKGLHGITDLSGNWIVLPDRAPKSIIDDRLYLEMHNGQNRIKTYSGDIVYFTDNRVELFHSYFLERLSNGMVWKLNYSGVIESKEVEDVLHTSPVRYSEFEDIYSTSEGYTGIRKDGKYGFVDDQNRLRIANRYDSIKSYHEGYAAIKLLGRWGFIDKEENIRIQPVYDWVDAFENGICVVKRDSKYFLIDKEGKTSFTSGFDEMIPQDKDRYIVRRGDQYGLVSSKGKMLVNFIYDELLDLGTDMVIIRKYGKYGVLDLEGMNIIPRQYDGLVYDPQEGHFFARISSDWKEID